MNIKKLFPFFVLAMIIFLPTVTLASISLPDPLGGTISSFTDLIQKIIDYIAGIIGTLAVLMFVIAGIYFVTSAGDSSKVKRAKEIVIYASIGVGVALAAGGLIALVRQILTGSPPL